MLEIRYNELLHLLNHQISEIKEILWLDSSKYFYELVRQFKRSTFKAYSFPRRIRQ